MNELNDIIESVINESAERIDVKALSEKAAKQVKLNKDYAQKLLVEKAETLLRGRIARIKDGNNVRDFYAVPVDQKHGVYVNATKSTDADALEKAAESLHTKIVGMEASRDKVLSQVFRLRHNVEIRDDATLDLKTPYKEDD